MIEFRWIRWDRTKDGEPPFGAIYLGSGAQHYAQVLQYRIQQNMFEIELYEPIWSDWINT